jgi:hypothetical protein
LGKVPQGSSPLARDINELSVPLTFVNHVSDTP